MKNKIVISVAFFFVLGVTSLFFLPAAAENVSRSARVLPTYFFYSPQEIQKLKTFSSSNCLSEEQLKKWDRIGDSWVSINKVPYYYRMRFFTYLYSAQKEAAFLSYNVHEHFEGSFDPISFHIFQLFFPDFKRPANYVSDPYSEKLAEAVLPHFAKKFNQENAFHFQYEVLGSGGYNLPVPRHIADCAKWIPWLVRPVTIYQPEPPPEPEDKIWEKQTQEIKNMQKKLTEEQKQAVYYWAGLSGLGSGDWRSIINHYLYQNNVPMAKILLVKSIMMMSLYDTCIAYLNAKYKFAVMRPSVRDPTVETLIVIPQHPSYPSGHSTEGTVVKIVMTYFFPDDKKKWDKLANEAGMSRIWAGVHYPIDHEAGKALGTMIGDQILNKLREQELQGDRMPTSVCYPALTH